jgi:nucleoside-diphosphate-sugar epimerase
VNVQHESFRVLVADAATAVGRSLVTYLADTEYDVRALVTTHDDERWAHQAGADDVVVADLANGNGLEQAVDGIDAICCTVSDGGRKRLFGDLAAGVGVRNLIDATDDADRPYVVLHSTIGVGDSRSGMVLPLRVYNYRILRALDATERYLRECGRPYTVIRTGHVTDGGRSRELVTAEGDESVSGRIATADLAWVMVATLTTPEARNRTFEVVDAAAAPTTDGVAFNWCGPETGLVARRSGYSIPS